MKKLIIIEGLPGIGKTTLVNAIRNKKLDNVFIIDEIINQKITIDGIYTEDEFIENDIQKIKLIKDGITIMDRGLISLMSYSQVKSILDLSYDISKAKQMFLQYKYILENSKVFYLTNRLNEIKLTSDDINSPYGTVENQKMLEDISINNVKKYCKEYVIREYYKDDMEKLIDEIIS